MKDLIILREEIDKIDKEIVELLSKRMDISLDVAKYKQNAGKQVLDESREAVKLDNVAELINEESKKESAVEIYKTILSESRKIQSNYLKKSI